MLGQRGVCFRFIELGVSGDVLMKASPFPSKIWVCSSGN